MFLQIPTTANPNRTIKVILNEQECTITLRQKGERLYLDLTVGDTAVCRGAVCLNLVPIVQVAQNTFSGNLVFVDNDENGHGTEVTYDGLGTRYFLVYYSDDEDPTNVTKMVL